MAGGAHRSRIAQNDVVRDRAAERLGAVPIGGVAAGVVAIGDAQTVIVADMALIAIRSRTRGTHLVVAGEDPTGGSVAPRGRGEGRRRRVAVAAIRGEKHRACGGMHRVIGAAVIGLMAAGVAAVIIRDARQIVVVTHVTGRAGQAGMETVENETGRAVIESRTRPTRGVMTRTALRDGETLLIVDRVIRLLIRGQVTAGIAAVRRLNRQRVVVVDMAGDARSRRG